MNIRKNKKNTTLKIKKKHQSREIIKIQHDKKNTKSTQKNRNLEIVEKNGWKVIEIQGDAFQRGYSHGSQLSAELEDVKRMLPFMIRNQLGVSVNKYMKKSKNLIQPIIEKEYPEFLQEISGISIGALSKGVSVSVDFLIAWNSFLSLYSYYKDGMIPRCSAFIATGNATKKGDIIMAHNTHSDFVTGQLLNIVIKVVPDIGNTFIMQTSAGLIASTSDWFLMSNGIIGCETTISDINYKPDFGTPYFCRIREVMQYADSFDDCIRIMRHKNAGDYACSWLFGDTRNNEIMLFELGLRTFHVDRKKNGVFYGMNSAIGESLRLKETYNLDNLSDISTSSGSRNIRLNHLLNEKYFGKIDVDIAKTVISDHYDIAQHKNEMNSISICNHRHLASGDNSIPFGTMDSKIVDSNMAKNMNFIGRFGAGCGEPFDIHAYIRENPRHKKYKDILRNVPNYPWTKI